jgi:hypothetical protein
MADILTFVCPPARGAQQPQITIPGIGAIQAIKTAVDGVPSTSAAMMLLLGQVSPALSPLVAVLRLVSVVLDIVDTFKSVTDPFSLPDKIDKLVKDVGLIGDFLPSIGYVKLVRDMLVMVESILQGVGIKIEHWVAEMEGIAQAIQSSTLLGDPDLAASAQCSTTRLMEVQQSSQVSLQNIGQILKVIKLIADIINAVIPVKLPGIHEIVDIVDTLATTLASPSGAVMDAAEAARLLSVAKELIHISGLIHTLTVTITQIIGE